MNAKLKKNVDPVSSSMMFDSPELAVQRIVGLPNQLINNCLAYAAPQIFTSIIAIYHPRNAWNSMEGRGKNQNSSVEYQTSLLICSFLL